MACAPPARRSSTVMTPQTSKPSPRTASIACTVEPPVVTTSSTIRQRSPGSNGGPSLRRWSPCALVSLRTKNALTSAPPANAAHAGASAPTVRPPTAVASHSRAYRATRSASAPQPARHRHSRRRGPGQVDQPEDHAGDRRTPPDAQPAGEHAEHEPPEEELLRQRRDEAREHAEPDQHREVLRLLEVAHEVLLRRLAEDAQQHHVRDPIAGVRGEHPLQRRPERDRPPPEHRRRGAPEHRCDRV